jgi:hypothetical protein
MRIAFLQMVYVRNNKVGNRDVMIHQDGSYHNTTAYRYYDNDRLSDSSTSIEVETLEMQHKQREKDRSFFFSTTTTGWCRPSPISTGQRRWWTIHTTPTAFDSAQRARRLTMDTRIRTVSLGIALCAFVSMARADGIQNGLFTEDLAGWNTIGDVIYQNVSAGAGYVRLEETFVDADEQDDPVKPVASRSVLSQTFTLPAVLSETPDLGFRFRMTRTTTQRTSPVPPDAFSAHLLGTDGNRVLLSTGDAPDFTDAFFYIDSDGKLVYDSTHVTVQSVSGVDELFGVTLHNLDSLTAGQQLTLFFNFASADNGVDSMILIDAVRTGDIECPPGYCCNADGSVQTEIESVDACTTAECNIQTGLVDYVPNACCIVLDDFERPTGDVVGNNWVEAERDDPPGWEDGIVTLIDDPLDLGNKVVQLAPAGKWQWPLPPVNAPVAWIAMHNIDVSGQGSSPVLRFDWGITAMDVSTYPPLHLTSTIVEYDDAGRKEAEIDQSGKRTDLPERHDRFLSLRQAESAHQPDQLPQRFR